MYQIINTETGEPYNKRLYKFQSDAWDALPPVGSFGVIEVNAQDVIKKSVNPCRKISNGMLRLMLSLVHGGVLYDANDKLNLRLPNDKVMRVNRRPLNRCVNDDLVTMRGGQYVLSPSGMTFVNGDDYNVKLSPQARAMLYTLIDGGEFVKPYQFRHRTIYNPKTHITRLNEKVAHELWQWGLLDIQTWHLEYKAYQFDTRSDHEKSFESQLLDTQIKGLVCGGFVSQYKWKGTKFKWDFAQPELKILIDIHGVSQFYNNPQSAGRHNRPQGIRDDLRKVRLVTLDLGWHILNFTGEDVKDETAISDLITLVTKLNKPH